MTSPRTDMTSPCIDAFPFLNLPRELRDQIYELVFFTGEDMSSPTAEGFGQRKLRWASDGLAGTAKNQIHPYRMDSKREPHFDLAMLRVNHQVEKEAACVFYGRSSFNLTMDYFGPGDYRTYEFLQSLPRRYRQLIRRIEHRCCDEYMPDDRGVNNRRSMLPFDWNAFMKFLAQECPSLRSLILWGFVDGREGEELASSCREDSEWVQAVLQIKTLTFFDIPAIPRGRVKFGQSCVPEFLEKLRALLYSKRITSSKPEPKQQTLDRALSFPFLKLPINVRNRVYRFALLPVDKLLHPYIKPWYDETTKNTIPLFLTCHQIHEEAEEVLYEKGIFCAAAEKYHGSLQDFFELQHLTSHRKDRIRFLCVHGFTQPYLFTSLACELTLEKLYYKLDDPSVKTLNRNCHIATWMKLIDECHVKSLVVETSGSTELDPRALEWLKSLERE